MFKPHFTITPHLASMLMKIESLKAQINDLPINSTVLASLRESAQLSSVHYSTMIEGNKLTEEEVELTIKDKKTLPGRERDQWEVLGYYQALDEVEQLKQQATIDESQIKKIHALLLGGGTKKIKPTPYRTVQNVIRDSSSKAIVYLPPEAKDVPQLMKELILWINNNRIELPIPILAAIGHYQFATIHPYIDGNGRTARLLTTLILHMNGYGLKGIYSLDEYYAKNLPAYYSALSVGPSHNYYMGREESDITQWIEYFCQGLLRSFEKTYEHASQNKNRGGKDTTHVLRKLDAKQRLALTMLFKKQDRITSKDIETLFGIHSGSARILCKKWINEGFLEFADPAKRSRSYRLSPSYEELVKD
jgi:Fic family protein